MLVVCSQTGTVLEAEHCLLFDIDSLSITGRKEWEDADGSDSDTVRVARKNGKSILHMANLLREQREMLDDYHKLVASTRKELEQRVIRSGDLTWNNCVPYSPEALREVLIDMAEEQGRDKNEHQAIYFAAKFATNEWLEKLGSMVLEGDKAWTNYKASIVDALMELYGGE